MWNRITALTILGISLSLLMAPINVEARGGGGRGGGGRAGGGTRGVGGAYQGGHVMNRTPTMSRSSPSRSGYSQARQQIQSRSSSAQSRAQSQQAFQQRPSAAANRTDLRNQVNQYAQNRGVGQKIDTQTLARQAQNFSSNRGNQIAQNRELSDGVSQRLQQSRPDSNQWFNQNFLNNHNVGRDYVGTGGNLWRAASWSTLAGWGAWNWSIPYYYDYGGYAYPLTSESTYVNPYSTSATYPYTPTTPSQPIQTQHIQGTQTTTTAGNWLPLGVFAVTSDAKTAAQANRFVQLAISRGGEVAGVLYNSATDSAQDLTGMVDTTRQKAYWTLSNRNNSPIASTGIYNLTEDQTPINVHFADGSDQTWTLVRIKQAQ